MEEHKGEGGAGCRGGLQTRISYQSPYQSHHQSPYQSPHFSQLNHSVTPLYSVKPVLHTPTPRPPARARARTQTQTHRHAHAHTYSQPTSMHNIFRMEVEHAPADVDE